MLYIIKNNKYNDGIVQTIFNDYIILNYRCKDGTVESGSFKCGESDQIDGDKIISATKLIDNKEVLRDMGYNENGKYAVGLPDKELLLQTTDDFSEDEIFAVEAYSDELYDSFNLYISGKSGKKYIDPLTKTNAKQLYTALSSCSLPLDVTVFRGY